MKQPVFIRVYFKGKLESIKQFEWEQIVVGRSDNSDVHLTDGSVSPVHAVIEKRDSGYYVSDLGSQGGTKLNDVTILDTEISSEDRIEVGNYVLEFFIGVPKPTSPPTVGQESVSVEAPPRLPKTVPAEEPEVQVESVAKDISDELLEEVEAREISKKVEEEVAVPAEDISEPEIEEEKEELGAKELEPEVQESQQIEKTKVTKEKRAKTKRQATAGKPVISQVPKIQLGKPKPSKDVASRYGKNKTGGTFAPPEQNADIEKVIRPGKGTVVEVIVAWRGRVISTQHFNEPGTYIAGTDAKNDVIVPVSDTGYSSVPFLVLSTEAKVLFGSQLSGEWFSETGKLNFSDLLKQQKLSQGLKGYELPLGQGEMIRWDLEGGLLSVYVRYVPESVKPVVAPLLDFTTTEFTGLILAGVISALLGLYMMVYAPTKLADEAMLEEPIRRAVVRFKRPKPKKPKVQVADTTKKKVVKVDLEKVKKKTPTKTSAGKKGKAASVRTPKKPKKKVRKIVSAVKKGGAIKTGKRKGSSARTKKKDVSKQGLLAVFGKGGMNEKLTKSSTGPGGLVGLANQATGASGFDRSRPGDRLGSRFKKTGAGGAGLATEGIAGAGTTGRGTGQGGTGTGGLGQKGNVDINIGGRGVEITGTIDREAIRRVIRKNKRQIKACYDRALNRNRDLYGKLVIEWNIEEKGIVTKARTKSNTLGNKEVANCIIRRLRTWRFPEPPEDQVARVAYPFVFQAQ